MTDGRPASLFVHVTDSVWPVPRMYNVGRLFFLPPFHSLCNVSKTTQCRVPIARLRTLFPYRTKSTNNHSAHHRSRLYRHLNGRTDGWLDGWMMVIRKGSVVVVLTRSFIFFWMAWFRWHPAVRRLNFTISCFTWEINFCTSVRPFVRSKVVVVAVAS